MGRKVEENEREASVGVFADETPRTADEETRMVPRSPAQCTNCLMQRCHTFSYCALIRGTTQARQDES